MTDRDWHSYWKSLNILHANDQSDMLRQVGKTILGKPIDEHQVHIIVDAIYRALDLCFQDVVVEVGCGNGLLTTRVSALCKHIYAADYSLPLIQTAQKYNCKDNITYFLGAAENAKTYDDIPPLFNKVYSYEMLQHLTTDQTIAFLRHLYVRLPRKAVVFLGSIPDESKIKNFYNTDDRWNYYLNNIKKNTEQIGHWWNQGDLKVIAESEGYHVTFQDQVPLLYTSHYRFDVILNK